LQSSKEPRLHLTHAFLIETYFYILTLSHFIRPCISEYAQTTQDKVVYHVYPTGTRVIKMFTANDFVFYNQNGHVLTKIDDLSLDIATSVQITWRILKNR
jgi:hypothetical protein